MDVDGFRSFVIALLALLTRDFLFWLVGRIMKHCNIKRAPNGKERKSGADSRQDTQFLRNGREEQDGTAKHEEE